MSKSGVLSKVIKTDIMHEAECPECGYTKQRILSEVDYFHVLHIPFWIMNLKLSFQCNHCGAEAGVSSMTYQDRVKYKKQISKPKNLWSFYFGWPIAAVIVFVYMFKPF